MIITKIAAIIVKEERLLVVRKRSNRSHYILPGGKPEPGETPKQAIVRELQEELKVGVSHLLFVGRFNTEAIFEDASLVVHLYEALIDSDPRPGAEIDDLKWIGRDWKERGYSVGSTVKEHVIPYLIERNRI